MTSAISFTKLIRTERKQLMWLTVLQAVAFALSVPLFVLMNMAVALEDQKTAWADADAKVMLVYALDTGLGRGLEYKTEPLKNVYEGIFTKTFTMFYGETLHYYFCEECDGQTKKSPERVLSMSKVEGTPFSKYQMINQILSARKLDKSEEVKKGLKKYLRQEQYVKEMFVITKED